MFAFVMKISKLVFCILLSSPIAFADYLNCLDSVSAAVLAEKAQLNQEYLAIDPVYGALKKDNESRIQLGTNGKAAIILHGYAESPNRVMSLANSIHELGYTTLEPLLPGFGSSAKVANETSSKRWQASLERALIQVSPCVDSIVVAGFSLGATIITDFLLNNPRVSRDGFYKTESGKLIKIESAILAAPFYDLPIAVPDFFIWLATTKLKSVDTKQAYDMFHLPDLRSIANDPLYNNTNMPIVAGRNAVFYGERVRDSVKTLSSVPVLAVFSEADGTINLTTSTNLVRRHFIHTQTYTLTKKQQVPHQVLAPDANPYLGPLLQTAKTFVAGHS